MVFLAVDGDRLVELTLAVRDYLGWRHVVVNARDLDLTVQQLEQATERRDRADQTAKDRLLGAITGRWYLCRTRPTNH